ncbi:MAG: type II toxin-antitoxin system RelE/ParE family toxin [Caldilineaceae bacterium]|nr:type II toxin-antitoxin system RelE/ParE family toxin [Caldilineaceae bacterium]
MIEGFKDKQTESLFRRQFVKRFSGIERSALKRLRLLDRAESLAVLAAFPGNRLEALKGDRQGQYSIRINDQWRICFVWTDLGAAEVEIVDYH